MIVYYVIGAVLVVLAGIIIYANLPTRLTIGATVPTIGYLGAALLKKIDDEQSIDTSTDTIQASELWQNSPALIMAVRRPGCVLCRKEAAELSTLKQDLDRAGVALYAVVHETRGVDEFKPYLSGDVYLDVERRFYGPNERWLPLWMGALRFGTYLNIYRAHKGGYSGNLKGEGRLLGGVYLIDSNKQLVYTHLEREWGDAARVDEVLNAVRNLE